MHKGTRDLIRNPGSTESYDCGPDQVHSYNIVSFETTIL